MATNFEPHEYVICVQSTKIGTHENKAIYSINVCFCCVYLYYIYNGIIFPSLNPAKFFQFISRWIESTKSSAVGPNHMRSD